MKNKTQKPRREMVLVSYALKNLKVRYWEKVRIFNPLYTGMRTPVDGGYQWLDFAVRMMHGKVGVLIFPPSYGSGRPHLFEKRSLEQKKAFLSQKGIPYLVLSRMMSSQQYEVYIEFWMRKEKRKYEKQIGTGD